MTKENLDGFIQEVLKSPELQRQLQDCQDKPTLVEKVIELAPGVTTGDVEEALKKRSEDIKKEIEFPLDDEVFKVFRAY